MERKKRMNNRIRFTLNSTSGSNFLMSIPTFMMPYYEHSYPKRVILNEKVKKEDMTKDMDEDIEDKEKRMNNKEINDINKETKKENDTEKTTDYQKDDTVESSNQTPNISDKDGVEEEEEEEEESNKVNNRNKRGRRNKKDDEDEDEENEKEKDDKDKDITPAQLQQRKLKLMTDHLFGKGIKIAKIEHPPVPVYCCIPGCGKIKRYSHSKTGQPICSLECYRKIKV